MYFLIVFEVFSFMLKAESDVKQVYDNKKILPCISHTLYQEMPFEY